jgi:hypothetical protein
MGPPQIAIARPPRRTPCIPLPKPSALIDLPNTVCCTSCFLCLPV